MTITIGSGTPIEAHRIEVEGGCVKLFNDIVLKPRSAGITTKTPTHILLMAYCLHPGETVRRTAEGNYEVIQ